MTVEGLKEFIMAQGSSRSVVTMEWDKIWSFNKKIIDPIAPRHFGLAKASLTQVNVSGATESSAKKPFHPKNESCGEKDVHYSSKVFVETADAETFTVGENVTFINWGNLTITKVNKEHDKVCSIDAKLNLDNTDYKKTTKVTWLADSKKCDLTPAVAVKFDNIISKPILEKDDDFKQFINKDTRQVEHLICDPQLKNCKEGDIIQLQRRGFYKVDRPFSPIDGATFKESPAVLFYIPDGHTKEMPKSGSKHKDAAKEAPKKELSNKQKKKLAEAAKATAPKATVTSETGNHMPLWEKVTAQGTKIRELKAAKAGKEDVMKEVGILKDLKAEYKNITGSEYDANKKPIASAASTTPAAPPASTAASANGLEIWNKATEVGTKIREMKASKSPKEDIMAQVSILKDLKTEFKKATGSEYDANKKPIQANSSPSVSAATSDDLVLWEKATAVGTKIREMKGAKAPKDEVMKQVEILKSLKADYKAKTGSDYDANKKPVGNATAPPAVTSTPVQASITSSGDLSLWEKVTEQGNSIRKMKSEKAAKDAITGAVNILKGIWLKLLD